MMISCQMKKAKEPSNMDHMQEEPKEQKKETKVSSTFKDPKTRTGDTKGDKKE